MACLTDKTAFPRSRPGLLARRCGPFSASPSGPWRRGAAVAGKLASSLGAALTWALLRGPRPKRRRPSRTYQPPRVFVAGGDFRSGRGGDAQALEAVRRYAGAPVALILPRRRAQGSMPRSLFGAEIDRVRLARCSRRRAIRRADCGGRCVPVRSAWALQRSDAGCSARSLPIPLSLTTRVAARGRSQAQGRGRSARRSTRASISRPSASCPNKPGCWLDVYGTLGALDDAVRVSGAGRGEGRVRRPVAPRLVTVGSWAA